jgi:hypothetical protein
MTFYLVLQLDDKERAKLFKDRLFWNAREKYDFNPSLNPMKPRDFLEEDLLKRGIELNSDELAMRYTGISAMKKSIFTRKSEAEKVKFEFQNKIASMSALKSKDWCALLPEEVENYGSMSDLVEFNKAWEQIVGTKNHLKSKKFIPKKILNGFRLIEKFHGQPIFLDYGEI